MDTMKQITEHGIYGYEDTSGTSGEIYTMYHTLTPTINGEGKPLEVGICFKQVTDPGVGDAIEITGLQDKPETESLLTSRKILQRLLGAIAGAQELPSQLYFESGDDTVELVSGVGNRLRLPQDTDKRLTEWANTTGDNGKNAIASLHPPFCLRYKDIYRTSEPTIDPRAYYSLAS